MRTIHPSLAGSSQLRQSRARLDYHWMERLRGAEIVAPLMLDPRGQFAGNILNKCPTEKYIQALSTITDRQHRLALRKSLFQKGEVGSLAIQIGIGGVRMPCGAKDRCLDIRWASGQHNCIECSDKLF